MRLEGAHPDYMIQRSLYQFQKDKGVASLQDEKALLEKELKDKPSVTDQQEHSFDSEAAIADYYHIKMEIAVQREAIWKIVVSPKYGSPFLTTGRLVRVESEGESWGWEILTQGTK